MAAARGRLVEYLSRHQLSDAAWLRAFAEVRREDLHACLRGQGQYLPPATTDWLRAGVIYDPDVALRLSPAPRSGAVYAPTPEFSARLLGALQPADDDRVLLVGAADGYLAGLLCHRLGDTRVTVTDPDADRLARVGAALGVYGWQPTMRLRDALHVDQLGLRPTHVLCAQPQRGIPSAWVRCLRLAGVIVAALSPAPHSGPAVRLVVDGKDTAVGRFLPGTPPNLPPGPHQEEPAEQIGLRVTGALLHGTSCHHHLWWPTPTTRSPITDAPARHLAGCPHPTGHGRHPGAHP